MRGMGLGTRRSGRRVQRARSIFRTLTPTIAGPSHAEVIDADSLRVCRDGAVLGMLRYGLANGTYRVTGVVSPYDGAVAGITQNFVRIGDNTSGLGYPAGPFDITVTITTGLLGFIGHGVGFGGRVDQIRVYAV